MNKEEIEDMFETLTEQWGDSDNLVNDLLSYSKKIQQENKQLKEKINKVIEWINKNQYYFPKPDKLLEILKESESE